MGLCTTLGAIGKKKITSMFSNKLERVDKKTPLGLKIGHAITLSMIAVLNQKRQFPKLQLDLPDTPVYVRFYGKADHAGVTIHRFYLSEKLSDDPKLMLQIIEDPNGNLIEEELKLFQSQEEIIPQTDEDWKVYLNDDQDVTSWIGYEHFDANGMTYYRDEAWGEGQQVPPLKITEIIYLDEHGENQATIKQQFMIYARYPSTYDDVEDDQIPQDAPVEWCLVSAMDDNDSGESWIEVFKGLNLLRTDFKVN